MNAVLRKLSQNKDALPPIPDRDEVQFLSIRYSHPKWLVKRLLELLGREETEAFLAADNTAAPLTVQVNPLKTTQREADGRAGGPGCPCDASRLGARLSGALRHRGSDRSGAFPGGTFPGAGRRGRRWQPGPPAVTPGQRVLDVCAAPGGKSFAAAFAMEDRGEILACDLHENKLKRIQDGAQRLGLTSIRHRGRPTAGIPAGMGGSF